MYVRVRVTIVAVGKQPVFATHILSMSVALIMQRAMRMRRIILSYGLYGCIIFFSHYLTCGTIFGSTSLSPETCVLIIFTVLTYPVFYYSN
jgi:hypothetical protein